MTSIATTLARFAADIRFEDLPPDVVAESKRILLDSLGCALAAVDLDKGRIGIEFAGILGGERRDGDDPRLGPAVVDLRGGLRQRRADQRPRLRRHPAPGPRLSLRPARRAGRGRGGPRLGPGPRAGRGHRPRDVQPLRQGDGLHPRRGGRRVPDAARPRLHQHHLGATAGDAAAPRRRRRDGPRPRHRGRHHAGQLAPLLARGHPGRDHQVHDGGPGYAGGADGRAHGVPRPPGRPGRVRRRRVRLPALHRLGALATRAARRRDRPGLALPARELVQGLSPLPGARPHRPARRHPGREWDRDVGDRGRPRLGRGPRRAGLLDHQGDQRSGGRAVQHRPRLGRGRAASPTARRGSRPRSCSRPTCSA